MEKLQKIAVLIDADNASPNHIDAVFQAIENLGTIRCKKIYGDWGQTNLSGWQAAILRFAIDPMQQFAYVKGKNATDIALVIEAMDLLHSGEFDGFCLVSSDSDFASLAVRIRKSGAKVFGFGKASAVVSFKQACDQFFAVESLTSQKTQSATTPTTATAAKKPTTITTTQPTERWTTEQLQKQTHFTHALKTILQAHQGDVNWVNLSTVASQLRSQHPNIKIEKYGYKKFSDLITAIRLFDIKKQDKAVLVKLKTDKPSKPKPDNTAQKPVQPIATPLEPSSQNKSAIYLNQGIQIHITSSFSIDCVLFRLTQNQQVRGDEDMIFFGQTHSEDGSLYFDYEENEGRISSEFGCDLSIQPDDISNIAIIATTDNGLMPNAPIQVSIKQNDTVKFTGELTITQPDKFSVLLFELKRQENGWQFLPKKQTLDADLRQICEKVGIEVSDD